MNQGAQFSERLSILTDSERKFIYGLPKFTNLERKHFFDLEKIEEDIVHKKLNGINSKIYFILQLGYFKFSHKFFRFSFDEALEDIQYILEKYFPDQSLNKIKQGCNRKTIFSHQSIILKLFSSRFPTKEDNENLFKKAKSVVSIDANPKYIFKEIVRFTSDNKIVLPAYSTLQKLVSRAIISSEQELFDNLKSLMDRDLINNINDLLKKESKFRYQLTLIKSPSQSFSKKQSTTEREKQEQLKPIFTKAKVILNQLNISNLSVKYFAELVDRYSIWQLCQFSDIKKYFYILCFVYHRYIRINDDLTKTFLFFVDKYKNEVKSAIDQKILEMRIENSRNLKKGAEIFRLITNNSIPDAELRAKAFNILPSKRINQLANFLEKSDVDFEDLRLQEYDKKFHTMRTNLRHIFKSLNFTTNSKKSSDNVLEAVEFLQDYLRNNSRKMINPPTGFIPKNLYKYLYEKVNGKKILIESRYEIFVYKKLRKKIGNTDIFIPDSNEYCSLESDLRDKEEFEANVEQICNDLGTRFLMDDLGTMVKERLEEADQLFKEVNENILNGRNPYFKFQDENKKRGKWHLVYEGIEDKDINNPLFKKIPKIDLADLVFFVNKKTKFFAAFTHILNRNVKSDIDNIDLLGAIIAYATNIGIGKMASCSNLSYNQLRKIKDNYLREETLKEACDIIINAIDKLPIQEVYNINDIIHSSIDGKKYNTNDNIFNARYSKKYLFEKGISVLTLIANFLPLGLRIISPNEYEGSFGLEILLMNESDVKPQINSTDMHGINELNHALYDFAGYEFQPRYTNIYNQATKLYCLRNPSDYPSNYIVKPSKRADIEFIVEEGLNMKRIAASIMSKTVSVSNIIKKLSTMTTNRTRKAIAEYNNILRTIHILKTINSLKYRQNIQIALNRGESHHQLAGNVSYANGGKIIAKTEREQLIFKECNRLVCNVIIYYNSQILSHFYLEKQRLKQDRQIEALKGTSPVAWSHINIIGKYNFRKIDIPLSFSKINELVKYDILVGEGLDGEDSTEMGLLN